MATHTVDVLIRARDEASRQFGIIGHAGFSMASMLRKAAAAVGIYLGARELIRFTRESLQAFGEQELAVKHLVDALSVLGPVTNKTQKDMQAFASEMQRQTTIADEVVLGAMKIGVTIGKLEGEALKKATVAAIGLTKGLGKEIGLEQAMELVSKGAAGITVRLAKMGIEVKKGATDQEIYNQILKKGAQGFVIAQGETKTYLGTLLQLKNSLGEIKKVIGQALMPTFKKWAETIRDWADRNREAIGQWAQKMVAVVGLVKDVFWSYIDFMRNDWLTGLQKSLEMAVAAFKGFGQAAYLTIQTIFIGMGRNLLAWIGEGINQIPSPSKGIEDFLASLGFELEPLYEEINKLTSHLIPTEKPIDWGGYADQIKAITLGTVDVIKNIMPKELGKSFNEAFEHYRKIISEITTDIIVTPMGRTSLSAWEDIASIAADMKKSKDLPAIEASYLTRWPGVRLENYQRQTAESGREQNTLTKRVIEKLDTISSKIKSVELVPVEFP